MKTLVILRGVSGAGKSTYIKNNFADATVCSADNFFLKDGQYTFDTTKLGAAHQWCFNTFLTALNRGDELIVVDNTNTKLWEFQKYVSHAGMRHYELKVIRLVVDPAVAAARNIHSVPNDKVEAMNARFQDFPGEEIVDTTPKKEESEESE